MLLVCLSCTTAYAVGASACPHCGSTDHAEEGTDMAKISRHGGPSNKAVELVFPPASDEERESPSVVMEEFLDEEPSPAAVSPYEGWLRTDLQTECERRGLPTSGNKAELVDRLVAADEQDAEEGSGTE